jgi:hypothetical protein
MNIFEIFQTEGSIDQALLAGIAQYQNYWLGIKEIIDNLFQTLQFNSTIKIIQSKQRMNYGTAYANTQTNW